MPVLANSQISADRKTSAPTPAILLTMISPFVTWQRSNHSRGGGVLKVQLTAGLIVPMRLVLLCLLFQTQLAFSRSLVHIVWNRRCFPDHS